MRIRYMKVPTIVPGTSNSPGNVSFLFPSKGLRHEEKNKGVPLVFVGRVPVGVPPFGCSTHKAARYLSSPHPTPQLQTSDVTLQVACSTSGVFKAKAEVDVFLLHFLEPVS